MTTPDQSRELKITSPVAVTVAVKPRRTAPQNEQAREEGLMPKVTDRQRAGRAQGAWGMRRRNPDEPACWHWPAPTAEWLEKVRLRLIAERQECGLPPRVDTREELRWYLMDEWADSRCAICGCRAFRRVEDHDHATGLFRGMLCNACNVGEGYGPRDEGIFARYRERNPAIIFNVKDQYTNPRGLTLPPLDSPGFSYG